MTRITWLLAAIVGCMGMAAQQGSVQRPTLLSSEQPEYSEEGRLGKLMGTVLVTVLVGEDGQPRVMHVKQPLGLGLDQAAMKSVSRWRFQPATRDGQPVAMEVTVEVSFHQLVGPQEWYLTGARYQIPEGATDPVLRRAAYDKPKGPADPVGVRLGFEIDEQGVPGNIRVDGANSRSDHELIAMVKLWRFTPATKDGAPVRSQAVLDFHRGEAAGAVRK